MKSSAIYENLGRSGDVDRDQAGRFCGLANRPLPPHRHRRRPLRRNCIARCLYSTETYWRDRVSDFELMIRRRVTKRIVGSGVNVVKSTLGGPQGNFEEAVAAIANAELLMEKQPEAFFKVQRAADFDRAKNEGKLGVIYSFESPDMLEDKIDRIELFRSLGVRSCSLPTITGRRSGAVVSTATRTA